MSLEKVEFKEFCQTENRIVKVTISKVRGSSPREKNCWMLVGKTNIFNTIGGGQMEFFAVTKAREILLKQVKFSENKKTENFILGPETGQCCGGNVELTFEELTSKTLPSIAKILKENNKTQPQIYIFGGGHVGKALVMALQHLPFNVMLVETRKEQAKALDNYVNVEHTALPEAIIGDAKKNAAYIVATHEHNLDYLIVSAALSRGDAHYVGMIGSKTKRAGFEKYFLDSGADKNLLKNFTCPIGKHKLSQKSPQLIAALVVAEMIEIFYKENNKTGLARS